MPLEYYLIKPIFLKLFSYLKEAYFYINGGIVRYY